MKTRKKILIAFILNLLFSIAEYLGGLFTGSVAILSDSVHDLGDALSIGIAFALEKKSERQPDDKYTYGYRRFSVLGGVITVTILIVGGVFVIASSVMRIIHPVEINYNGMIILAIVGCAINLLAAWFTREGDSINRKAVNLHMLEDVLGWLAVLAGAIIMRFTDIRVIDPLMSIAVSLFIVFGALKELKKVLYLFLEKAPAEASVEGLRECVTGVEGVLGAHHIHVRSIDGYDKYATMHIVTEDEPERIKRAVKEKLKEYGVCHVTLELERPDEDCGEVTCIFKENHVEGHEGHHHHHH